MAKKKPFPKKEVQEHHEYLIEEMAGMLECAVERLYTEPGEGGDVRDVYDLGVDSLGPEMRLKLADSIYKALGKDKINTLIEILQEASALNAETP
jgi:hypothetical protein